MENPAGPLAIPATKRLHFGWIALGCGLLHLAWCSVTELRSEHLVLDTVFMVTPWVGPRCQQFMRMAFPLWLTGLMVDNQRFMHVLGAVHTGDIYQLDARLFPAGFEGHALSWAERLSNHPSPVLDFFCGLAYLLFLVELILIAIYLYVRGERATFSAICWAFFVANAVGVVVWLLYPVAPPWYVLDHGFGPAMANPVPSAAGTVRFDALLHIHYFRDFYARNPNVYGAMPSLHVAYPAIATWYTWRRGWGWRTGTLIFTLWMGFSAVYLAHHYVLDVVAGYVTAVFACAVGSWWVSERFSRQETQLYKLHSNLR